MKVETEGAYSNITLNAALRGTDLSDRDKALAAGLFYGVLDRKITLDYALARQMKTPLKKVQPYTLTVLRTALYQILYMDKIPDSAAVNEAVKAVRASRESRNAGFVNAVLRNLLRQGVILPDGKDTAALSVRYSCPEWIVRSFCEDYGAETAENLLKESLKPAPTVLRVNTLKTSAEELIQAFGERGVPVERGHLPGSLVLLKGIEIAEDPLFRDGLFHAEDEASQYAVSLLAPRPGDRVLDLCAAPGGKSFTMAQWMENQGELLSCDLYPARVELIRGGAKRLGLTVLSAAVADATVYDHDRGEFDDVLCDVPCSGLGVLRRKPDIKYRPESEVADLPALQYTILENAAKYVKRGGKLLYSTCTLRRAENEAQIEQFLKEHHEFQKRNERSLMPHMDKTDGFYCALLEKE